MKSTIWYLFSALALIAGGALILRPTAQEAAPPSAQPLSVDKYCNSRYHFCVEYPAELFTQKDLSENNDGIVLTSAEGDVQVRAYGYYNVMDWPIQDEYEDFLTVVKSSSDEPVEDVTTTFSGDSFECTMKVGKTIHYERTMLIGENFINLTIVTNRRGLNDPSHALEVLKDLVRISTNT